MTHPFSDQPHSSYKSPRKFLTGSLTKTSQLLLKEINLPQSSYSHADKFGKNIFLTVGDFYRRYHSSISFWGVFINYRTGFFFLLSHFQDIKTLRLLQKNSHRISHVSSFILSHSQEEFNFENEIIVEMRSEHIISHLTIILTLLDC